MERERGRSATGLVDVEFDLGFDDIDVNITPHNLIFGELLEKDSFNWAKKVEIAAQNSGISFAEFEGGYAEFYEEFTEYFSSLRRFTYTPMIWCKGKKPAN